MDNSELHNEKTLLHLIAAGDEAAFDQLFRQYWDHVYSVALIMTKSPSMADDISQDVFLALLKSRTSLGEIENLKGFLYSHVKFNVHKRLRRIKIEEAYQQYLSNRIIQEDSVTDTTINLRDLQSSLQKGIEQLPPQQKRAFQLSRERGLNHEQISDEMGVSKKTVKDYIVRSIAFLKQYLKKNGAFF